MDVILKISLNKSITYRPEIDGLRTLAVLPVILFHAGFEFFSGGYIGVDVFFVISGYLITSILLKELESGSFSILNFYERRARRIMPALFFVVFACIPLAWLLMVPEELKLFGQSLVSVSTFSSNVYFWLTTNYFSASAEELPLLHTWSLAVEEQFYLIFPLLLAFFWRQGITRLLGIIVGLAIISILLSEYGWRYNSIANFYLLPTRGWELLLGAILAFPVFKSFRHIDNARIKNFLANVGFSAILFSIFFFDKNTPFPSVYSLVPVIGTCLIICFATKDSFSGMLLSSKPFVGIGLISYSAYLWHQPLFAFSRMASNQEPSQLLMMILALSSLLLAYISWRFVEAPFRQKNAIKRNSIFVFSTAGISLLLLIGLALHFGHNLKAQGTLYADFVKNENAIDPNYGLPFIGCNAFDYKFSVCATKPEAEIFLWGDSFAAHLTQFFDSEERGLVQATMSSCFPNTSFTPYENSGAYNHSWAQNCHKFANNALKYAIESEHIKFVVISSTYTWPLNNENSYDGKSIRSITRQEYLEALAKDIKSLRLSGKEVVIVGPTPTSNKHPLECAKKLLLAHNSGVRLDKRKMSQCDFEYPFNKIDTFLQDLSIKADVAVVDPRSILCDENNICSVFVEGFPVYKDWGHLSPYGARRIQEVFDIGPKILDAAR
jgi:peptidoglycan/LPS O-acetylase OafA/YrhL